MEKITVIVSNLVNSVQVIVDVLINLVFQPIFALITIVQSLIEIWSAEPEEETEQEPQQQVTEYPSANAGRPYPEECDPPVFTHIGFKINQTEKEELDKIKEELNNGK
jgi:hypothetical protein